MPPTVREVIASGRAGWGKPELRMPTLSMLRHCTESMMRALSGDNQQRAAAIGGHVDAEDMLRARECLECPEVNDLDWLALLALARSTTGAAALDVDGFDVLVQFISSVVLTFSRRLVQPSLATTFVEAARLAQRSNASIATKEAICRVLFAIAKAGHTYELYDTIPIVSRFLLAAGDDLLMVAASTLQAMCSGGSLATESLLCSDGVQNLCALLYSPNPRVVGRALNALHALSVDLNICKELCMVGAVPILTVIIQHARDASAVASAAGLLQNIGREKSSSIVLQASGTAQCIMPLLIGGDTQLQAAAVGVLLNMHGGSEESRGALKAVISAVIVEEALRSIVGGGEGREYLPP